MNSLLVSKIKTNVFNLEIELKEQNNFLGNEKDNVRELQHHIDCEENDYRCVYSKPYLPLRLFRTLEYLST